jgi:hypothetical protein
MVRKSLVLLLLLCAIAVPAAPAKKKPATLAPEAVPHSIALFLGSMSNDGRQSVTFKATAVGTRFFFEEPAGVTVYRFENGRYIREEFLRDMTLEKAIRRYAKP